MSRTDDFSLAALEIIKGLMSAVSTARLYFSNHPHVGEKIKEVHGILTTVLAEAGTYSIVRLSDEIIVSGKPIRSKDGAVEKFSAELLRCGISQVSFEPGLTIEELSQWFNEISAVKGSPLLRSSAHLKIGHVDLSDGEGQGGGGGGASGFGVKQLSDVQDCYTQVARGEKLNILGLQSIVRTFLQAFEQGANPLRFLSFIRSTDEYTYTHAANVFILTTSLAEMAGVSQKSLLDIGTAALVYDMGKLLMPKDLLKKSGKLSSQEMQIHTIQGAAYLMGIDDMPRIAVLAALEHHIRYDGKGYPQLGDDYKVHPVSRMISICDTFDAMRSRQPSQDATSMDKILKAFERERGRAFDPELLDVFLDVVRS